MGSLKFKTWVFLPFILLIQTMPSQAQSVCDAPEVKLGNNFIQIAPTGADDTENIQCALDLAVERNLDEIRLTRGDFSIGALSVQGFSGTLQGGGRNHTRLMLRRDTFDCGYGSAAIRFHGGEPRVRWLSLTWELATNPCPGILLHFTGSAGDATHCSTDLVYATVDRVELHGPSVGWGDATSYSTGVAAWPLDSSSADCSNRLLGTVRVNRSFISGFGTAVRLNLQGGAQAGIFQNTLDGNHTGLFVHNSHAVLTVSGNHFASVGNASVSSCFGAGVGIDVSKFVGADDYLRLDLYRNTFEVDVAWPCSGFGIRLNRGAGTGNIDAVISGNRFRLYSIATGIHSVDVSGGTVNNNTFETGSLDTLGVLVSAMFSDPEPVSGWAVVSNSGFGGSLGVADIILGEGTSNNLVGPGQGARVVDNGIDNSVLPQ